MVRSISLGLLKGGLSESQRQSRPWNIYVEYFSPASKLADVKMKNPEAFRKVENGRIVMDEEELREALSWAKGVISRKDREWTGDGRDQIEWLEYLYLGAPKPPRLI